MRAAHAVQAGHEQAPAAVPAAAGRAPPAGLAGAILAAQRQFGNRAVGQWLRDRAGGATAAAAVARQTTGRPLGPATREQMLARFGRDFGDVRVHADDRAADAAAAVNAAAYTLGCHVVFGRGMYEPGTAAGQRLLTHELTHVAQQDGRQPAGEPRIDPPTSAAEQAAARAAASPGPVGPMAGAAPALRRQVLSREEIEAELRRIDEAVARGGMSPEDDRLAQVRRQSLLADLEQNRSHAGGGASRGGERIPGRGGAGDRPPAPAQAEPAVERSALAEFGSWLAGAVMGEFNPDQSIGQIGLDTVLGLIPIVDQGLDARDIVAHIYWMSQGEYTSAMRWVGVVVTAVGLIPELGTAIRGVVKVLLKGVREALGHVGDLLGLLRRLAPGLSDTAAVRRWLGHNWPNWVTQASQAWGSAIGRIRTHLAALPGATARRYERVVAQMEQLAGRYLRPAFDRVRAAIDNTLDEIGRFLFPNAEGFGQRLATAGGPGHVPASRLETGPMQMSSIGGGRGGPRSTGEAIDDLEDTVTRGSRTRESGRGGQSLEAEAGKAIEPGEVSRWAAQIGPGWRSLRRADWPDWVRRLFPEQGAAKAGPDVIHFNDANKRIIVGDVAPNPGSRVEVRPGTGHGPGASHRTGPGAETTRAGDEGTRMHIEKTIEDAQRLRAALPQGMRDYAVFAQEWFWENGGYLSRLIPIP